MQAFPQQMFLKRAAILAKLATQASNNNSHSQLARRPIELAASLNINKVSHLLTQRHSIHTTTLECQSENGTKSANFKTISVGRPAKHVAHLELNRPKSKNAFGLDSGAELISCLDELEEDSSVRVIMLSGVGADFTSGVDLKSFTKLYGQLQETEDVARRAKLLWRSIQHFQAPFKRMAVCRKPIVGVQHGLCLGLGMELASCCDVRYCSRDTKFAVREVLIGIAADVGSLQLLPRLINNQSLLRELVFTGRYLSVEEAKEVGFVSAVMDSKEAAIEKATMLAKTIAARSPVAVQGSKQNLRFSLDKSLETGLDYNAVWNMSMMQSGDVLNAIGAIFNKEENVHYDDF